MFLFAFAYHCTSISMKIWPRSSSSQRWIIARWQRPCWRAVIYSGAVWEPAPRRCWVMAFPPVLVLSTFIAVCGDGWLGKTKLSGTENHHWMLLCTSERILAKATSDGISTRQRFQNVTDDQEHDNTEFFILRWWEFLHGFLYWSEKRFDWALKYVTRNSEIFLYLSLQIASLLCSLYERGMQICSRFSLMPMKQPAFAPSSSTKCLWFQRWLTLFCPACSTREDDRSAVKYPCHPLAVRSQGIPRLSPWGRDWCSI